VTVGDFMKVVENPAIDNKRIALFMPTAQGPCRFGQYAPYLRQILDANGYAEVEILSPTSQNAYDGLGTLAGAFVRNRIGAISSAVILVQFADECINFCRPHATHQRRNAPRRERLAGRPADKEQRFLYVVEFGTPDGALARLADALLRARHRA
jgi:hypothetical protein